MKGILIYGIDPDNERENILPSVKTAECQRLEMRTSYEWQHYDFDNLLDKGAPNKLWHGVATVGQIAVGTQAWGSIVAPSIKWLGNFAGDVQAYDSVFMQSSMGLLDLLNNTDDDITIVAHSLGSVLAFDMLCYLSEFKTDSEHHTLEKIKKVFFVGSPLDRWAFKHSRGINRYTLEDMEIHWIYGNRDFVVSSTPAWTGANDYYLFNEASETFKLDGCGHDLLGRRGYLLHPRFPWWLLQA